MSSINMSLNAHAFLDVAIFLLGYLATRYMSLLSTDYLPVEI